MEITLLGFDAVQWRRRSRPIEALPALQRAGRCVAASGGSRRDMQKIVARTKHRRARHMKLLNKRNSYDPVEEELVSRPHILDSSTGPDDRDDGHQSGEDKARDFLDEDGAEGEAVDGNGIEEAEIEDEGISSVVGNLRESLGEGVEDAMEEVSSTRDVDPEPEEKPQRDGNPYASLKVLVAGASGRTGRLLVEKLSSRGAQVRALCRDLNKASRFDRLSNVTAVRGDLCKYESLKKGLGDSNVVICAIGTKAFALDILSTYKIEYEGVVNLIAAAKNQGGIKKFVLVTSIGVSSLLQIIPILWWKRQAELALQRSGLDYTIVRPAGLRETAPPDESIDMRPENSIFFGGISRSKVAEVCVEAIVLPEASEKIVEIVANTSNKQRNIQTLFAGL